MAVIVHLGVDIDKVLGQLYNPCDEKQSKFK